MKENEVLFDGLEEYMIALLRCGILDEKPMPLQPSSRVDWDRMMDIASSQGILAWVWDGIVKLPKEFQPPRQQAINWGLSVQEIWDRYHKQKQVLVRMLEVLHQNNIRLLLFKGIALSELYPSPHSRPSGDIDFYLFGDYEKGNALFAKDNVTKTNKRTGFDYKGVHIENHRIFLNAYTKMQVNAIKFLEGTLDDVVLTKDGYYIMSPTACIIYQIMHFIAHLDDTSNPLSFRFIVDFGVTMNYYQKQVNPNELKLSLDNLKITNVFCLLLKLVETTLGMTFESFLYKEVSTKDCIAVINLMDNRPKQNVPLIKRRFSDRLFFYFDQYKKYDQLFKYLPQSRIGFIVESTREMISISIRRILKISPNISLSDYIKR